MTEKVEDYKKEIDKKNKELLLLSADNNRKDAVIDGLKEQLRKTMDLLHKDGVAEDDEKQLRIDELTEQLKIAKLEAAGYKEDFEQERRDRERLHSKLTDQLTQSQGVAYNLQMQLGQTLHDRQHSLARRDSRPAQDEEIEALQKKVKTLQEQNAKLEQWATSFVSKGDKADKWEEEKQVSTSQVKSYCNQCEGLKTSLAKIQKEVTIKQQQVSELQKKVAKLSFEIEAANTEHLKLLSVYKNTEEKLEQSNNQLSKLMSILPPEYLRILDLAPSPPNMMTNTVGLKSSLQNYSSSYDHPQVTMCQTQQFVCQQREHDMQQLQWHQKDRLKQIEEQRKRECILANKALQEVEKAEQKRNEHQGVYKPKMHHFVGETSEPFDNPILQNIDQNTQCYDHHIPNIRRPLSTAKVENEDKTYSTSSSRPIQATEEVLRQDSLEMMKYPSATEVLDEGGDNLFPYDPNFKCHKCGRSYRINEIQKFKKHINELCPKRNDIL